MNAAALAARCEIALRCARDYARTRGTDLVPAASTPRRRAWVTLLTNSAYASGVKALHNSLLAAESEYPLVVMATPGVPSDVRDELTAHGCEVLPVEALSLPDGPGNRIEAYASAHFAECWSKLRLWELEQFEQVALLDADMIVLKSIDGLLDDAGSLPPCCIRAVHECFCAVKRGDEPCAHHARSTPLAPHAGSYFNSGLMVLRPSRLLFTHMLEALAASDLSACAFAEQDFLNTYFRGAWQPLPWTYNATKTLYACHRARANGCAEGMWELPSVRILHFTMAKPWELKHPLHKGFERLNTLWWAAFACVANTNRRIGI